MSLPNERETRIERYLGVIAQDGRTKPNKPETRIERYLDVIATESVINDARISNIEKALENDVIMESFEAFAEPQTLPENVLPNGYINSISGKTTNDGGENVYNTPQSVEIVGTNLVNQTSIISGEISASTSTVDSLRYKFSQLFNSVSFEPNTSYTISFDMVSVEATLLLQPYYTDGTHDSQTFRGNMRAVLTTNSNKTLSYFNITYGIGGNVTISNSCLNTVGVTTYVPYFRITKQSDKIVEIKNKLVSLGYSINELGYSTANKSNYIDYTNKKVVLNCYLPVSQIVSEYLEPIEIDVSDIIDDGDMLLTHLENGGTISCKSEHDIDLPFETTIYEKVV